MPHFTKQLPDKSFGFVKDETSECHSTEEMKDVFQSDGYVIVRNLFSESEIDRTVKAVEEADCFWSATSTISDSDMLRYSLTQWKDPGDDIFGLCGRNDKVVGICEELLDEGELYMYSGKIIMKQAETGGRLEWHQDYGYWYNNECIKPDLVSCFIALTKNDRENGGLEVIRGSHKLGRLNHGFLGGQQGADMARVELIKEKLDHLYCDLKAGDSIFFHCNLLHSSQQNLSPDRRWNLIFSYNTVANSPQKPHYNAIYTEKLWRVTHDAIERATESKLKIQARNYFRPDDNPNIRDAQALAGAH